MRHLCKLRFAPRLGRRGLVAATVALASVIAGAPAALSLPTVIRGVGTLTISEAATVYETGQSDAESILIYSALPGWKNVFWWDHANLTVAVRAPANSDPAELQAMRDAIEIWHTTLAQRLPQVSLTDVTDTKEAGQPDIVLRLVTHAGGTQWSGITNCGVQKCLNVIIRTDVPPGENHPDTADQASPLRVQRTTLHELGHALGIGHVSPRDSSRDLMGYGWAIANPDLIPILSDCDIDGIKAVFSWVLAGEVPHKAREDRVICSV